MMYSEQANELIREKYETDGATKLAALTGLTVEAVRGRAKRMGLKIPNTVRASLTATTKKAKQAPMDDAIKDRYPNEGPELLAHEFNHTKDYIMSRAFKLGVKRIREVAPQKPPKPLVVTSVDKRQNGPMIR